jgi:hypothetical protein
VPGIVLKEFEAVINSILSMEVSEYFVIKVQWLFLEAEEDLGSINLLSLV